MGHSTFCRTFDLLHITPITTTTLTMKFFILLAVVATASAIPYHAGIVNTGQR